MSSHRLTARFARLRLSQRSLGIIAIVCVLGLVAAGIVLVTVNSERAANSVGVAVPVAIKGVSVPKNTVIGVILTLGTSAEGSEWNGAAQGARVAQQRLRLAGTGIELRAETDGGTAEGGRQAVDRLVRAGVSGIVLASSGSHTDSAIAAAARARIPLIAPYETIPDSFAHAEGVWSLAPSVKQESEAVKTALGAAKHPLLIDAGGALGQELSVSDRIAVTAGTDLNVLASNVAARTNTDPTTNGAYLGGASANTPAPQFKVTANDAIVVSAPARVQSAILQALQAKNVTVPTILSSNATSPAFATASSSASVATNIATIGAAWGDATALERSVAGANMSGFLAAVRLCATDSSVKNLSGDAPFSTVAAQADSRSHDAVLALARALANASSADPHKVATALRGMRLEPRSGIAGPQLNFTRSSALDAPVAVLAGTLQNLQLRPDSTTSHVPSVTWFAIPSSSR